MIFSADLDRTLLFTRKQLTDGPPVVAAEYRQGAPFSFLTAGALTALRALQRRCVFLVNTMRGLEQAKRVSFVGDGSCRYLALQNGLALYRDGVLDRDWADYVRRTVEDLPLDLDGGIRWIERSLPGLQGLSKRYDYLAVFFVADEGFDGACCAALARALAQAGWSMFRQRRKLYLSPLAIDKGAVLRRVRALEGGDEAAGFGDSWFDLPMLRESREAYALQGCELDGTPCGFPIRFSTLPAQAGSEEILAGLAARWPEGELSPTAF